jgi:hypothetical protein
MFVIAGLVLLGGGSIAGLAADPKPGKLVHIGLVWLKNPGNEPEREKIMEALRSFRREIPEVRSLSMGRSHGSSTGLMDASFDVCFTLEFDDQAALDRYAKHPVHERAAREVFLPLSKTIRFHDYINVQP